MEQDHISATTNSVPDTLEEARPATQQPGYIQRAVKTLSQRTKTLLSPWTQRRVDNLRARNQGEVETARPLTMTHRNTQRLLHRVRQAREHSVVWKPDIGALKPDLVERFSSTIANHTQTLRLIGIRRQPAVPATAWEGNLELTLPLGSASQVGQVIERIPSVSAPQGLSIFTAGQPIEPFKPTTIPAQSSRPTASPTPKRKPAQKQLPPQARLYARVEEISPHDETPDQETHKPSSLITPAIPQPAGEEPAVQQTVPQSHPLPAAIASPPVAATPIAQNQRQAELPLSTASPEISRVMPRRPRPTPPPPVQRKAVSDEVPHAPQKPAPSASPLPEAQPPRPVVKTPSATKRPAPAEAVPPRITQPVASPVIQRAVETSSPRAEQPRPRSSVEAPAAAKPVTEAHLPRAIVERPATEQPAQIHPPRALPIEPPIPVAKPVSRAATPAIPRAVVEPGGRPGPEPPATPQTPRRVITPPRPVETPQPPRLPSTLRSEERPTVPDFPQRVEIQRATELATVRTASPERAEVQPPPVAPPPELRRTVKTPEVNLAASATLITPPDEGIKTPLILVSTSPATEEQSREETVLPLHKVIQRRADSRSHGLLRTPVSPPTLRPITRIQPQVMSAADKMHVRLAMDEPKPSSSMAASPTLYARSPNLYIGPGPAPTVMRTRALPQAQKRVPGDRPKPQPPMDLRMAMSTLMHQEEPLILPLPPQPTPARPPVQPSLAAVTPPESVKRPAEMPLARQQAASSPAQAPRSAAQMAEPVTRPSIVGELVQRDDTGQSANEESKAPEPIDLGKLAHQVYPLVKRLIAIERERMAR